MHQVLTKLQSFISRITIFANIVGALVLLVLVLITNAEVFSRNVYNEPFNGVTDMVVFALVMIVFLQLPDVARSNRLTRSDGLLSTLHLSVPRFGAGLSRFIDGMSCLFMCLIFWTVWPEFLETFETCHFFTDPEWGAPKTGNLLVDLKDGWARCEFLGTRGVFTVPWWPMRLAIAFGIALAAIVFFLKALLGDPTQHPNYFMKEPLPDSSEKQSDKVTS